MAFHDLARRMGAPPADGKDPHQLIAEGANLAARQQRNRNLILGTAMLVCGFAFGILGVLSFTEYALTNASELVFGLFGLAVSLIFVGWLKLAGGLTRGRSS